jgi:hypothetical protein
MKEKIKNFLALLWRKYSTKEVRLFWLIIQAGYLVLLFWTLATFGVPIYEKAQCEQCLKSIQQCCSCGSLQNLTSIPLNISSQR